MLALVNCSANTCQSDKGWFMALKQQGQKLPSLELFYLHLIGGLEDACKTFSWSGVKIKNRSPNLSPSLTTFSRYENIFAISHQCLISQQTRSFESTFLSPSPGQEFIPYQLYLRTSTKKITHISSPDIFGSCFSSRFGGKPTMHVQPDFLLVNQWRDWKPNFNFNHRYQHHFQGWVKSNYLLTFHVSVSRFAWDNKVLLLRFAPFKVRQNSGSKFPDYIWAHLGISLLSPFVPIQWTHSIDDLDDLHILCSCCSPSSYLK